MQQFKTDTFLAIYDEANKLYNIYTGNVLFGKMYPDEPADIQIIDTSSPLNAKELAELIELCTLVDKECLINL